MFTLFERRRFVNNKDLIEPVPDEHVLLDDNKYIADIMQVCAVRDWVVDGGAFG